MAIPSNKPQNRILLVGGIIFALLAGVVVFLAVNKSTPPSTPSTVPVVVATQQISAGSTLSTADLSINNYAAANAPTNFYSTVGTAVGRTATQTIAMGAPITTTNSTTSASSGGTTSGTTVPTGGFTIADGYAALAIPTSLSTSYTTVDQMTVGYYVQAGDQIDILAQVGGTTASSVQFGYLFQDVPVLAIGYAAAPVAASPGATPASTLTAPSYFVVEMPEAQAVEMTAILTGTVATNTTNSLPGMVLKYVLRPQDEYGAFSKPVTSGGVTSITFTAKDLTGVPTVAFPGSPVG